MEVELRASLCVAELEEKLSALEKEKADLEGSLASARSQADTSTKKLEEAQERARVADETAKTSEARRQSAEETVGFFRQAVAKGALLLQCEVHKLLERFGLDASPLAGEDVNAVELVEFFCWLWCCVAMIDCGSQLFGELNTGVAARSLMAVVCSLLEAPAGGKAAVSNTRLRSHLDTSVQWPSLDEVKPDTLAALPRNIAKNFMVTFYQERGRELVAHEGERMKG